MNTGNARFLMLLWRSGLVVLAAALLTACGLDVVGTIVFIPPSALTLPTATPVTTSPEIVPISLAATQSPGLTGTSVFTSPLITPPAALEVSTAGLATSTVTLTATPFSPCSPLNVVPLDELRRVISDPYHPPEGRSDARHTGVDFAFYRQYGLPSIDGVEIDAVLPGKVASVLVDAFPYGNAVMIETPEEAIPEDMRLLLGLKPGQSLYMLYAHMQATADLKMGAAVGACQGLGWVGMTGNAGAPHLHLEVRRGPAGVVFEGMRFYVPIATPEERLAYRLWALSPDFLHLDPMSLLNRKIALAEP